jgi:hypothetical protein
MSVPNGDASAWGHAAEASGHGAQRPAAAAGV